MKYKLQITINKPREQVIELFDNQDNLKYWQKGFVGFEHLSGKPGTKGAMSLITYKMGTKEIELIETITQRQLPDEFSGTYESKGMWNKVKNYFTVVDDHTTKWKSEIEIRFSGFMKVISFLMPWSFKRQSYALMVAFKNFAEQN